VRWGFVVSHTGRVVCDVDGIWRVAARPVVVHNTGGSGGSHFFFFITLKPRVE